MSYIKVGGNCYEVSSSSCYWQYSGSKEGLSTSGNSFWAPGKNVNKYL